MKPTIHRIALAAVVGLGLAASAAAAQDRGPAPGGPRGGDHQKLFQAMQHRREQRLHDLLQIKPDQEGAFHAFTAALEQARPHRGARPERAGAQPAAVTAPERLDRAAQRLADAQQRLQRTASAVKAFYAVLTPDQKKAFDAMPMAFAGGRRGFGGRGMVMRGRFEGPPPPTIR